MFGVAINHFQKPGHPLSVQQSTQFAVALLKNCLEVTSIIVIDSSADSNGDLSDYCLRVGAKYVHYGRVLSFSEAYNLGVGQLQEEWVATMASDIYVLPDTFTVFKRFIETHPVLPIGCLIPYLSTSDYPPQEASRLGQKRCCYSGIMTYNLNIFPKQVFGAIGGLSNQYSGNFNDIETSLRLRAMDLQVVLVDSFAYHYGRMTLQHGSTTDLTEDCKVFRRNHPQMLSSHLSSRVRLDRIYTHPLLRAVYSISSNIRPRRFRANLEQWTYRNLPKLQRVKS